jgi:PAS domain-containing protein
MLTYAYSTLGIVISNKHILEAIVESIPSSLVVIAKNGKVQYFNQQACELYGVDQQVFKKINYSTQITTITKFYYLNNEPCPIEKLPSNRAFKSGKKHNRRAYYGTSRRLKSHH